MLTQLLIKSYHTIDSIEQLNQEGMIGITPATLYVSKRILVRNFNNYNRLKREYLDISLIKSLKL